MKRYHVLLACVARTRLLAVAITYPLIWHLTSVVPHDLGDPLLSASILWWNAHVAAADARDGGTALRSIPRPA